MLDRGNSTLALVVLLASSMAVSQTALHADNKSAAEYRSESMLQEWKNSGRPPEEIHSSFHKMILDLDRAETQPAPLLTWQMICEDFWILNDRYFPITESEAIWKAKAFLIAYNDFDPDLYVYARMEKTGWHVWFEDRWSMNSRLVIISKDGTAFPVSKP